jgi:hypothetical protein
MRIQSATIHNRQGWLLDNGVLKLFLMKGGGHIADLRLKGVDKINPFWAPVWKSIEPWEYDRKRDAGRYGVKLLACIYGHNLCLSAFGDPSPEEEKCGLTCHYEAPVARWSVVRKKVGARSMTLEYGCNLPAARMRIVRAVSMRSGSHVINVRETIQNLARRDVPFTICQHVTFGPPFLEPGVTAFDMPSVKGRTFPGKFGSPQRLKSDHDFKWPDGPGVNGGVDLRFAGQGKYSDFSANLMDPKKEQAWFSAVNPRLGLMMAYVWRRADYPWVGIWEENRARKTAPWNGKSLTRGMEFTNTPFPVGLRKAVDTGKFQGQRAYAWLPARGKAVHDYSILATRVGPDCAGVANILPTKQGYAAILANAGGQKGKSAAIVVA